MTNAVIRPIFSVETMQQRKQVHDDLIKNIMTPDAFDEIGGEQRPNKLFFRLLADAYGVDCSILREEEEYVACNPDVCASTCTGNHYETRFVVRATHRETSAYMDGDGSCIDNEKWPIRRKRLTKGQRDLVYKLCQERSVNGDTKAQLAQRVSGGRVNDLRALNPQEASELLDFMLGNIPSLEPVLAIRNTRHNVRGTARTRAVNRAISDLVAGGVVSAEEIVRGHEYTDKKKKDQQPQPAQPAPDTKPSTSQPAAARTQTPAAASGGTDGKGSAKVLARQKSSIERLCATKHISESELRDMIRQATDGRKQQIDELSEIERAQLLKAIQRPAA